MKRIYLILAIIFSSLLFAATTNAQANTQTADTPLKVRKKPQPSARGCQPGNGRMQIKVTFDKSAVVTDVLQVSESGCDPFDRSAIIAAKKIKFEPATKAGVPVTVVRTVEYVYGIY